MCILFACVWMFIEILWFGIPLSLICAPKIKDISVHTGHSVNAYALEHLFE